MRHTQQRAQGFFLQKLNFHISMGRNRCLLAGPLGAVLVSLSLLLGHCGSRVSSLVTGVVGIAAKKVRPRIGRTLSGAGGEVRRPKMDWDKRARYPRRDYHIALTSFARRVPRRQAGTAGFNQSTVYVFASTAYTRNLYVTSRSRSAHYLDCCRTLLLPYFSTSRC